MDHILNNFFRQIYNLDVETRLSFLNNLIRRDRDWGTRVTNNSYDIPRNRGIFHFVFRPTNFARVHIQT